MDDAGQLLHISQVSSQPAHGAAQAAAVQRNRLCSREVLPLYALGRRLDYMLGQGHHVCLAAANSHKTSAFYASIVNGTCLLKY